MTSASFAKQLQEYGPGATRTTVDAREAERYCRRLASRHYENFSVVSRLLPRDLRQHFCNVYAYCRWADDLADETAGGRASLDLLDWWQSELEACYAGRARHPALVALQGTIGQFDIPASPFLQLLAAFRLDQHQTRYETFDELLAYCRHSANPVGHLVLYLGRCFTPENALLSDQVCTGLQLANFWQDLARDFERGRVYLPRETRQRFGYGDAMLEQRLWNESFRQTLRFEVERAEELLRRGAELPRRVGPDLRCQVELFIQGGLSVLRAIRKIDFNVWARRPVVGKWTKVRLLLSAWWRVR